MTSTKVQPPRKLTEEETLDTFEDFWFQCECYYSRDPKFAPFFDDKNLTWWDRTVANRGLQNAETAANLNSLLRALATYTSGPYVKNELLDVTKSLKDIRKVFLKFLEIDITDHSLLNYYSLTRKPNERPLVFYHRLRYHILQHQLPTGTVVNGKALESDETVSATMDRFIIMEWLHRLDNRLVKFIQEKFATELSSSSTYLITMVESLAKNVDKYITQMDAMSAVNLLPAQSFSPSMHSNPALMPQESEEMDGSVMFSRGGFNRGGFNRGGFNRGNSIRQNRRYQPPQRPGFQNNRLSQGLFRCEFCYMQSKGQGKSLDYNHNITNCPQMIAKFSKINLALGDQESDTEDDAEESREFQEFYSEQL